MAEMYLLRSGENCRSSGLIVSSEHMSLSACRNLGERGELEACAAAARCLSLAGVMVMLDVSDAVSSMLERSSLSDVLEVVPRVGGCGTALPGVKLLEGEKTSKASMAWPTTRSLPFVPD